MKPPKLFAKIARVGNHQLLQVVALLAWSYLGIRTCGSLAAPEPLPLGSEPVPAHSRETG